MRDDEDNFNDPLAWLVIAIIVFGLFGILLMA